MDNTDRSIHRRKRLRFAALIGLAAAVLGAGLAAWMQSAVRAAGEGRVFSVADAPAAEVGVVFGARVYAQGGVSWPLEQRLATALRLYEAGKVRRLLVSGDNRFPDYNEPDAMRAWLVARGVPEDRISCDYGGRRTLDTCARAARLWDVRDALLISQAYHLPRALYLARAWGLDARAVAAPSGTYRRDRAREWVARVGAWLDVNVFAREPALWGPPERWPAAVTAAPATPTVPL